MKVSIALFTILAALAAASPQRKSCSVKGGACIAQVKCCPGLRCAVSSTVAASLH